ncbi:MAG: hypothetical protein IBJ10_03820, partial [Phycisphaerales bacterium]|nr:hypothetical protein [Phycisphaerales bacterium]
MSNRSTSSGLPAHCRAAAGSVLAMLAACGSASSALVAWNTNSNGNWATAANWSSNPALPGPLDDVTIDRPAAAVTVTLSNGDRTINSLSLAETIRFSGGTLAVTGAASVTGQMSMAGGTLIGGTWTLGSSISMVFEGATTSTLQGVTLNGTLNPGLGFNVRSGLTVNGNLFLNPNAALRSLETQTIDADLIGFISTLFPGALHVATGTTTSLSGGTLVEASAGSRGEIRNLDNITGGGVVNDGVIRATGANSRFSILNSTFHNNGQVEALSGGIVAIGGTVGDPGTLTEWTNSGVLRVNGGTLVLGGRFDIDPLDIERTGGNVILAGTLINSGQTTTLDATSGPWLAGRGVIEGGTLNLGSGGGMLFQLAPGLTQAKLTVNDVVVNGDMDLGIHGSLDVRGGLEMNGVLRSASKITSLETQTFDVDSIDCYHDPSGHTYLYLANATTLTLGAGATMQAVAAGGASIQELDSFAHNTQLISEGTLRATGQGSNLYIGADHFVNNGVVEALDSGLVTIGGRRTSQSPYTTFENNGALRVNGGTLSFGGSFWVDPASIDRTGGAIVLAGAMQNEGRTFTLNGSTGGWRVGGGEIVGGTVNLVGPNRLQWTSQTDSGFRHLTLTGVTLNGTIELGVSNSQLTVRDGMTLDGAVRLTSGLMYLNGDQAWNGGSIELGSSGSTGSMQVNGNWTIGSTTTVTGRGAITSTSGSSITNQGLVLKESAGSLHIGGAAFENQGTLRVTSGSLEVGAQNGWTNSGLIDVQGGTFLLQGAFTNTGSISKTGGSLDLAGTALNAGGTITMDGLAGSWTLSTGGRIVGGEVNFLNGARFLFDSINDSGTLQNVTMNGDTSVIGGSLGIQDSVNLNGSISFTGTSGRVVLTGAGLTIGAGEFAFVASGTQTNEIRLSAAPVTLGEDAIVRGGAAFSLSNPRAVIGRAQSLGATTLINQGLITADRAGMLLAIHADHLENEGVVKAEAGGALYIGNVLNNTGSNAQGLISPEVGAGWLGPEVATAALGSFRRVNWG